MRDKLVLREAFVEYAIEPVGFLDVAIDRVRELLRCVVREMMVLACHRTKPTHLPEEPFHDQHAAANGGWQKLSSFCAR